MISIAIDGACRRNGKPDCVSSGGMFIQVVREGSVVYDTVGVHEYNSTNQRGEMLALIGAMNFLALEPADEVCIVTDSEYIYNAMTKKWYERWANNGWKTAAGDNVKNSDLWRLICVVAEQCEKHDINYYHIKGHCIPFGKVTANSMLSNDSSGKALYEEVSRKFDTLKTTKAETFEAAQRLSERNNGFRLPDDVFKDFVVSNVVVDAVATVEVDEADTSK